MNWSSGVWQRHVVQLDVLPRRDVRLAQRHPAFDHVGEAVELLGVDAAEGKLHADHLALDLALAVDALLEAEADELVLRCLPVHELPGLAVEIIELAFDDRDDVPGDVLVDLRIGERTASAAGAGCHATTSR